MRKLGTQLLGTQRFVMEQIGKGLEEGKHFFVILKGRQLGITTISLALDLYWHFINPGFQGTLTTDTEENRDVFRTTLGMYMDGLPPEYKIPLLTHNRNQMVLKNRSRLFYQVAGIRAKGLEEGKHFFVILKGRQLGITTISLALDLYWHFINPGFQGVS